MKRNWVRGMIGGVSFTAALFVFQACYGTPQDMMDDIHLSGKVTSMTTGLPIEGVRVSDTDQGLYEYTDHGGEFSFYTTGRDKIHLFFEDVDSEANGRYTSKDTVLVGVDVHVIVDIALEEK